MRHSDRNLRFYGVMTCLAALFCLTAAAQSRLPDGSGKRTLLKTCGTCHSAEAVVGRHGTLEKWNQEIATMIVRGAKGTDQEFLEIATYLSQNFGDIGPPVLPDGPGREVVVKVCTSCHGPEKFVWHEGNEDHWQAVVDKMISKGATATNAEFDQVVAYLSKNFGYIPVPSNLPPGAGKELVDRVCGSCHGVSLFIGRHADIESWYRTIDNMVRRGAQATDAELDLIAQYLAKNFGPAPEK
jgi:mono/diheme cytochrome c family protein